jgi:hypothetical protein
MGTSSQTTTFTATDIRKVVDSFAADLWMIAQSTGLRSRENVESIVSDLKALAESDYLLGVTLILSDSAGAKVRARRYTVSTQAIAWGNDQPGGNLWPKLEGGSLQIIGALSDAWWNISAETKNRVRERIGLKYGWELTSTDTSFSDMTARQDKRYSSNGFGIERTSYE